MNYLPFQPTGGQPVFVRKADYLPELVAELDLKRSDMHRYILVGHLFDDTLRMVQALSGLMEFDAIVGIPYSSGHDATLQKWEAACGPIVHCPRTEGALAQDLERVLSDAFDACRENGQKLIVQEVSGYVLELLHTRFSSDLHLVEGVVEVTKQGVWRAERPDLALPVLHCSDTELKRFEAKRSGEAIARCCDSLARSLGISLAGRHATVFGAGWIGSGVVEALRRLDAIPAIVDTDPLKVSEARLAGYAASLRPDDISRSDLVIGATGRTSITRNVLNSLRNGCLVASGSSRRVEIDTDYLDGFPRERLHTCIDSFFLPGGPANHPKQICLLNDGFPVNFMPGSDSVADELFELILGEIILLMARLTESRFETGVHGLDRQGEALCAKLWLEHRDRI